MNSKIQTLKYYNNTAKEFVEDTVDVEFRETQELFLEYIPSGGRILDFGCGSGRDTKYFLSKGYEVDAVDGSEEICKAASQYTGVLVKQMLFEELTAVNQYDGIWACASILHVTKKELPMVLNKIAAALKRGAAVYISFKYGDFEGIRNGRFFTYLTDESFRDILKKVPELKMEKIWISTDVRAERGNERWLNLILKKQI